jgi:predicted RNA-binding protein with TRAM domain
LYFVVLQFEGFAVFGSFTEPEFNRGFVVFVSEALVGVELPRLKGTPK